MNKIKESLALIRDFEDYPLQVQLALNFYKNNLKGIFISDKNDFSELKNFDLIADIDFKLILETEKGLEVVVTVTDSDVFSESIFINVISIEDLKTGEKIDNVFAFDKLSFDYTNYLMDLYENNLTSIQNPYSAITLDFKEVKEYLEGKKINPKKAEMDKKINNLVNIADEVISSIIYTEKEFTSNLDAKLIVEKNPSEIICRGKKFNLHVEGNSNKLYLEPNIDAMGELEIKIFGNNFGVFENYLTISDFTDNYAIKEYKKIIENYVLLTLFYGEDNLPKAYEKNLVDFINNLVKALEKFNQNYEQDFEVFFNVSKEYTEDYSSNEQSTFDILTNVNINFNYVNAILNSMLQLEYTNKEYAEAYFKGNVLPLEYLGECFSEEAILTYLKEFIL